MKYLGLKAFCITFLIIFMSIITTMLFGAVGGDLAFLGLLFLAGVFIYIIVYSCVLILDKLEETKEELKKVRLELEEITKGFKNINDM